MNRSIKFDHSQSSANSLAADGYDRMKSNQRIPAALFFAALIFALFGFFSLLDMIGSLANYRIKLSTGILGLFIGIGLTRLSRGWRTCGLVSIWLTLIGTPLLAIALFASPKPLMLKLSGQQIGTLPKFYGAVLLALFFVIAYLQYRILTRPDIRELFGLTKNDK